MPGFARKLLSPYAQALEFTERRRGVMPEESVQITGLVSKLADALLAKRLRLATAESCTGGWISQELTALAGSSQWFECGFVTYSNEAKQSMLDVPSDILESSDIGAVSEQTVRAMTAGAILHSRANLAVAVSGVAGPEGGSQEKPVGTVCIAWQWESKVLSQRFQFLGGREAVRRATVVAALEGLLLIIG